MAEGEAEPPLRALPQHHRLRPPPGEGSLRGRVVVRGRPISAARRRLWGQGGVSHAAGWVWAASPRSAPRPPALGSAGKPPRVPGDPSQLPALQTAAPRAHPKGIPRASLGGTFWEKAQGKGKKKRGGGTWIELSLGSGWDPGQSRQRGSSRKGAAGGVHVREPELRGQKVPSDYWGQPGEPRGKPERGPRGGSGQRATAEEGPGAGRGRGRGRGRVLEPAPARGQRRLPAPAPAPGARRRCTGPGGALRCQGVLSAGLCAMKLCPGAPSWQKNGPVLPLPHASACNAKPPASNQGLQGHGARPRGLPSVPPPSDQAVPAR